MKMDAGMDTGPAIAFARTPIDSEDNAETIHDRLALLGASLLVEKLPRYLEGSIKPVAQPEGATHARKITKEDGRLNWKDSAEALWNRVRALTPWPGTFAFLPAAPKPLLVKIWKAKPAAGTGAPGEILAIDKDGILVACGSGALQLIEVQREGGKRLPARDFVLGCPMRVGQRLE
jgi:methionyl-tRNA formyltransferase